MTTYTWTPLELFANGNQLVSIFYQITAVDGEYKVESQGNLTLLPGTANKPLTEIVESDLIQWLDKDTTQDGVNIIKSNLEDQLMKLKTADESVKVDFPWLAGTFTI